MYKITKLKSVKNPIFPTADTHDEYRESLVSDVDVSPPVDYWIIGELLAQPTVGRSLMMKRYIRNGVEIDGFFSTSCVTEITETGFCTMNSEYLMEKVNL